MSPIVIGRVLKNIMLADTGRMHPFKVMSRFLGLQMRRKFGSGSFIITTATGTKAIVDCKGDFSGVTHLHYHEYPDMQENAFACHALRRGDVFWDVGANQGYWSLLLAGRMVEAHAFEPTPITFKNQSRQFALQDSPFRELLHGHNTAMGTAVGRMRFTSDRGQANYLLRENESYDGAIAEVEVTTMDEFAKHRAPNLIKIDVEGWTEQVLRGGCETLASPSLWGLVIETFRFADGDKPEMKRIESILAEYGFRPCRYDPQNRKLHELKSLNEGRQDTIYARDDARLHERLKNAEPIRCFGKWI